MQLKSLAIGLLIVLLPLGLFVAGIWDQARQVETVEVERGDLSLVIRVTGEVINDRRVELTALVDGQVIGVEAGVGDRVSAGQILAKMDNRAAAANRQRAEAFVQQHAVLRKEAKLRYQRLSKLVSKGAVTEEQQEDAQLEWQAASAVWQVAKAELLLTEVAQEWQVNRAPFDAVVVKKSTEKGQWVEAGTPLFSLVALDGWQIEAHVDAVDSGRIKLGQPIELKSDAFPGKNWRSEVSWIGPNVEQQQERRLNTFKVRLDPGEAAPALLLGQQVDLEILVAQRKGVLKLPFMALKEDQERFQVGVIEAGLLSYREVAVGLQGDSHVELLSGILEGDKVVLLESAKLESGIAVQERTKQ
ncbi:MAG: efflux RND transporter periplasmic adaptor subunit [Candidatus Thiodiazotropha lotti]|nr:efflux RND transporter periplasmic adaptor subunit [Candidatus Thiodiazotropha lotti]MCG7928754.1 efflux RND transporter periplasmic adaptor subunit [Candidatus Thiodiazotropha lotti]MCG8005478.1 efflux RND transporter periplasmic adaptor subunit [Candidatus Thiodiazotropha lotti]MCG8006044.1 efflux RND transporter periplasmic adaptor subunit [Candidatus Thiodiazotropha lotti]MCW4189107.1 efflux RND transporter periplasmic adaptor subunit [Candidatus Thiodiazotropha lotti]